MPKELLLKIKPSKLLLAFYFVLDLGIAYIFFHRSIDNLWLSLICISLGLHLLFTYYAFYRKRKSDVEALVFIQNSGNQTRQSPYISYLQYRGNAKQTFKLVAAWQFFARCVLLKCKLMDHKKHYWCLLLPDSLVNRDHLRKLILMLRFGQFILPSDIKPI